MMKITKKSDYGLTFLAALADKPNELLSLRLVAKDYNLPYKFIGQVAAQLLAAGIITSKEGATGGYKLAKSPEQISFAEVMNALDGPMVKTDCMRGKTCPRRGICAHQYVISNLNTLINQTLDKTSLADITKKK